MPGLQSGQVLFLLLLWTGFAHTTESMETARPYYIRPDPAILLAQPLDGTLLSGESVGLTCEVKGIEPIISGWWPHIYWLHNDSIVNSTWPGNVTIDTNYWNRTTLHTPFPGAYQCIVDDGSFILASRLATVKEANVDCIGDCATPQMKGNFHMVCGQSVSVYSWYKDGVPLKDDERIVIVTNDTMDPFGLYTCNTRGVIRQWYLPVQESREVTSVLIDGNPSRSNVFVGHSGDGMTTEGITLQCTIAVNESAVNITWFHNGVQNHNLSTDSVHFPKNSHVDAIAGTYVCAASTINWEARVQFRILLKHKPNPPDSVTSRCVKEYPEINAQDLRLSWTHPLWNGLVDGIDLGNNVQHVQWLLISRHNHPNEVYHYTASRSVDGSEHQTLRLDSEYCITLAASAKTPNTLDVKPYFLSLGNSTLHHCNKTVGSCPQVDINNINAPFSLTGNDTLFVNCGELQDDEQFQCSLLWQQLTDEPLPYTTKARIKLTCPERNHNQEISFSDVDRVFIADTMFQAFNCQLECQLNINVYSRGNIHLYSRSGHLISRSYKHSKPTIQCLTSNGKSFISVMIPQDDVDRIQNCSQLDINSRNTKMQVLVFESGRVLSYPTQLNTTLEIPATDFTNNGNQPNGNTTVIVMYSNTASGTSDSTAINIPGDCTCRTGWMGNQCKEAICSLPCVNGRCSEPDTCKCFDGWTGSQCNEALCNQPCLNGGVCSQPNTCTCVPGWLGTQCETDSTQVIVGSSVATGGLLLCIFILFITGLCLCYRYKRNPATDLAIDFDPGKFVELASVAECDVPTIYNDTREDIEKWLQEVSQDEEEKGDPGILKIANDVSSYIEVMKTPQ